MVRVGLDLASHPSPNPKPNPTHRAQLLELERLLGAWTSRLAAAAAILAAAAARFAEATLATARLGTATLLTRGGGGATQVTDDAERPFGRVRGGWVRQGSHQL